MSANVTSNPVHGAAGPVTKSAESTPLIELTVILVRYWRQLVLVPLLLGLVALGISFLVRPTFSATARIIPPSQPTSMAALMLQQLGALASLAGGAGLKNPADQYVTLAKSRTVAEAVIKKLDLRNRYERKFIEEVLDELDDRVRITASSRDGMVTIEASDHDPEFAARLANEFVDRLRDLANDLAVADATHKRTFYEQQLAQVKRKLEEAQTKMQRSGVGESLLKSEPRAAAEEVARLRAAATATEVRISTLRGVYADGSTEMQLAKRELAAIREQLSRAESSSTHPSGRTAENYVDLYRNFKYFETLYEMLARQFELSKIDEANESSFIQVVDLAVPAEKKSKPKRGLIAVLTTIATFVILLGFLAARETFNRLFRDPVNQSRLNEARSKRAGLA